ncbi:hypothetical protein QGX11_gp118 [Pseudomonas phage PPSC2]|uniref:Uncharacterized protein n=1 Tax=Pseudomonas phage PPSC2 TaxID=2041350 RepID=A0A2R2YAT0_9CAUD|nr:hypothetical protein QGX11_gp118 [Pseudomonas phage PPSC2]ATN92881.1 hypothetical protein PPSC2_118 [Pseudomonas phage PPSC2]
MKLPMLTPREIALIAERTEVVINNSNSRSNHRMCVENAIREAQALIIEKLDVQVQHHYFVDLTKG